MLSAAASLGTILLWDVDGGLTQIDKYLYSSEDYIKVGGTDPCMGSAAAWCSPPPDGCVAGSRVVVFALVCCVAQFLPRQGLDAPCPRFLSSSEQGGELLGTSEAPLGSPCHRAMSFGQLGWI